MRRLLRYGVQPIRRLVLFRPLSTDTGERPFNEIPQPRWSLPYFGTVLHYRLGVFSVANRRETLLDFHRRYGPIVRESMHGETVVHLFEPDDYRQIYAVEGRIPSIIPLLDAIVHYRKQQGYGLGVGNINGEDWYRLRAAVRSLMMRPVSVANFLDKQLEVVNDFVEHLMSVRDPRTDLVSNLELEIGKWNYETAGYNVFDRRLGVLKSTADDTPALMMAINGELFEKATKMRFAVLPMYKHFNTPLWRKLVKEEDVFYRYVMDLFNTAVAECRQSMETDEGADDSGRFLFLKSLLQRDDITLEDCHITSQSLFTDGFSTTVPTSIGQLYCLAANPEKQEALYKEICDVIGANTDQVTFEQLNQMPYLRSCVKEGFRFFPIGLDVSRITHKDLVLSGYHVPAGTAVELNNFAVLQDEKYFNRPEIYLPERWLRGNMEATLHPYAHTPFSHGPRQCLGRRFAEQEMYLLLARLVQRFRLEWRDARPMRQRWRLLNVPDIPARIAFIPRIS